MILTRALFTTEMINPIIEQSFCKSSASSILKPYCYNHIEAYTLGHSACPSGLVTLIGVHPDAQLLERHPVRPPYAHQEPRLRYRRDRDARPRHGCQHHPL